MKKVWFLTGSSAGLGRSIAEAVLESGDMLAATARNPERLNDFKEKYGDNVLCMPLDVTDRNQAAKAVAQTLECFGQIDVLVNNAGYGHFCPFEQETPEDFRAQIETNLFGVVNTAYAVIPHMRKRRSGYIFNVSSVGGRSSTPGLSAYQAAKWAVGGFSEVLSKECAEFNVKVCCLEPGGIRTNWGTVALSDRPELLPEYKSSIGAVIGMLKDYVGNEMSSPEKFAKTILELAKLEELPMHLLIGADALHFSNVADDIRKEQAEKYMSYTLSTMEEGTEVPHIPFKE